MVNSATLGRFSSRREIHGPEVSVFALMERDTFYFQLHKITNVSMIKTKVQIQAEWELILLPTINKESDRITIEIIEPTINELKKKILTIKE